MSRTYAHVPLRVRIARGDIAHEAVHDHTDGVCDLPDPLEGDLGWVWGSPHCHWMWLPDGHGLCACEQCHGGSLHRSERRAERQRVRRALRLAAPSAEAAEEY